MKKILMGLVFAAAIAGNGYGAETIEKKAEKLIKSVQEGCKTELSTHCKDVTPGEGRVLACLYAFGDKLSSQCEYALYDAAAQLERAVAQLTYVATECSDDLDKFCAGVQPGEGRILNCLKKNEKKLADRCAQAIKDTAK